MAVMQPSQAPNAPPPEGAALEAARERLGISQNEAAKRSGMSGTRWRQIISGFQGTTPVRGSAKTLAKMSKAVGLPPEILEEAGRPDAANQLRGSPADEARRLAAEIDALMAGLPPERRERMEHLIQAEEEALERARLDRLNTVLEILKMTTTLESDQY